MSTRRSPLAGMGFAQKVAAVALAVLAIIALVAVLAGQGTHSASGSSSRSASDTTTSATQSSTSHRSASTGSAEGSAISNTTNSNATDGLGTVQASALPAQAQATLKLIDAGGPFPYSRDGIVFSNNERVLPKHPRGWYHEYTVPTPGASTRGTRRLIQGKDGTIYYTSDHYVTFKRVIR